MGEILIQYSRIRVRRPNDSFGKLESKTTIYSLVLFKSVKVFVSFCLAAKQFERFQLYILNFSFVTVVKPDSTNLARGVGGGHFWADFSPYTESYEDLEDEKHREDKSTPTPEPQPHFLDGNSTSITAQLGGKVTLLCRVGHLGDKTVVI